MPARVKYVSFLLRRQKENENLANKSKISKDLVLHVMR